MSDLLMIERGDGGELVLSAEDLMLDETLFNPVYLSLFEGENYYSNLDTDTREHGSYTDYEKALNSTTSRVSMNQLESLTNEKLNWLVTKGIAETIETTVFCIEDALLDIDITITQPGGESEKYSILWDKQMEMLKKFEVLYAGL